ncbi:hypothetical protein Bbelb_117490 [Branchiostoma belcheri]|nr:hypothetical protein Bbelb_117490 [Branchiostoma belcheri]
MERVQKRACRIILGHTYTDYTSALQMCKLETLEKRRATLCTKFAHSMFASERTADLLPNTRRQEHGRNLRNSDQMTLAPCRTARYQNSPHMNTTGHGGQKTKFMVVAISSGLDLETQMQTEIKTVDTFCYLGSRIMSSGSLDAEVTQRIGKASVAFGRLSKRLWQDHGIRLSTKIAVYIAVVLSTLLYWCETWTTYRRHIQLLEQFHQRCLRNICSIRLQDKVSNLQVLETCGLTSVECMIVKCQLRWAGHVVRMEDSRIPKVLLYGQLKQGQRNQGRPLKR